ncbi:MAG: polyphosphate--nucleotide phosphotransferase, partial [Acidovorax sp.]|nr:polyphosphate--nucleotide phosphotransferase [Acidovorax sp.]
MPDTPASLPAHFSVRDKTLAQRWSHWQPGPPRAPGSAAPGKAFSLDDRDPGDKPFSWGNKAEDKAAVEALAVELDALQNLFYADKRYKLLVVLQGTDTSGKDG